MSGIPNSVDPTCWEQMMSKEDYEILKFGLDKLNLICCEACNKEPSLWRTLSHHYELRSRVLGSLRSKHPRSYEAYSNFAFHHITKAQWELYCGASKWIQALIFRAYFENYPEDTKKAWQDAKFDFQKSNTWEDKRFEIISHDHASDEYFFNRNRMHVMLVIADREFAARRQRRPLAGILLRNKWNNQKGRFYYLRKYARGDKDLALKMDDYFLG